MAVDTTQRPASTMLPPTLRSRLTLTVLLANVALMVVGGAILFTLLALDRPSQLEREARSALHSAANSITARTALLDAVAATTVAVPGMEHMTRLTSEDPDAGPLEAPEAGQLLQDVVSDTNAGAAAVITADRTLVALAGDAGMLSGLEPLIATLDLGTLDGVTVLAPDRIALVAIRPLPSPSIAWLVLAEEVAVDSIVSGRTTRLATTVPTPADQRPLSRVDSPYLGTTTLEPHGDEPLVHTELLGVNGQPVAWLTLSLSSEPMTSDVFGLSFLVASGLAVIVSLSLGLLLTTLIRRPLDDLITHIRRHGHAALEGHETEPFTSATNLPVELQNLAEVYNSLIEHLKRKQVEAFEATRALQFAVNNSSEGKILLRDDHVALVNVAAATLLGLPVEAPLAAWDTVLDSLSIESEDGAALTPDGALALARRSPLTIKISGADIPSRWVELRVVEHDDPQHTTLLTGRDVTEQRRVDAVRTEIVSLVSHDLRAPLTVINGYLDILERPLPDEKRAQAVESARQSAGRMAQLLEDLLSATRAEELFVPTSFDPVSLSALAEETVTSFEHTSPHTLVATVEGSGVVLGEERRLRQVLVNLVTNATKHTPAGGRVEVGVEARDGRVVLTVQDTGPGISIADRKLIFERFARLDANGENRPGIGLGLYIVRAIVESHGGTVWVEERPDGAAGARFVVELPEAV